MDGGPSITERIYAGIKADLLAGAFRPGERLDAATLARQYGASVTPIREALNRLAGERLIAVHAHQGFKVLLLTEGELKALYDWAGQQLIAALRLAPPRRLERVRDDLWPSMAAFNEDPAAADERVCLVVAQLSGNPRCRQAVAQSNAELALARRLERQVIAPETADLRLLPKTLERDGAAAAEALLIAYCQTRIDAAADIIRLMTMAASFGWPPEGGA